MGGDIIPPDPDLIIQSNTSLQGWGAVYNGITTGGHWSNQEKSQHINLLELLAGSFAVKAFYQTKEQCPRTTADGQPLFSLICEQDGWHSLTELHTPSPPYVGMVPSEKDPCYCGTSPRHHKHYQESSGVISKMDASQGGIQHDSTDVKSSSGGPLCHQTELPTPRLHQLEA